MNLVGSSDCKPCQKPPKAPVFKMGDIVETAYGDVYSIGMIFKMHSEIRYAPTPHDWNVNLAHGHSFTGHSLKLYKGKK